MIQFTFIDTEESAISSPEPDIVVSDEPAVSTEEEEPVASVDVQKEVQEG